MTMGIQKYGSYKSLIFTRWESEIKLIHIEKQYFMKKMGLFLLILKTYQYLM